MQNITITDNWRDLPSHLTTQGITSNTAVIITDTNVAPLYLQQVLTALTPHLALSHHTIPAGETSKSFATLQDILTTCQQAALDRSSLLIALGGGVVSDLTGLAASLYMRGIKWIALPTTLLAQADSAIGGKTGIDMGGAKNLIGTFHQPAAIYANVAALKTLPQKEFISGLAEVIKYGIMFDGRFFEHIQNNRNAIAQQDFVALQGTIRRCCEIKSHIVTQDEHDNGIRQTLNYGHTFGHAIETLLDFKLPHGHCVSLGMMCAAIFSRNMGGLPQADVDTIRYLLDFFGLPTALPPDSVTTPAAITSMMRRDKKARDGGITLIVSHKIGSAEILHNTDAQHVQAAISAIF